MYSREQDARYRIEVRQAHASELHYQLLAAKSKVASLGAVCVGFTVLGAGFCAVNLEMPSISAFCVSLFCLSRGIAIHQQDVSLLDGELEQCVVEAEGLAREAGIPFSTNYVSIEERVHTRTFRVVSAIVTPGRSRGYDETTKTGTIQEV